MKYHQRQYLMTPGQSVLWCLLFLAAVVAALSYASCADAFGAELAPGQAETFVCRECPPPSETCADFIHDLQQCATVRDGCLSIPPCDECAACPPAEQHDGAQVCLQPGEYVGLVAAARATHVTLDDPPVGDGGDPPKAPKSVKRGAWIAGAIVAGLVIYHWGQRHGDRDDVTNVFIEGDTCRGRCD